MESPNELNVGNRQNSRHKTQTLKSSSTSCCLVTQTNRQGKEMWFLVSDIGREDTILGYPWLTMFEPRFSWTNGTIDMNHLPIVL